MPPTDHPWLNLFVLAIAAFIVVKVRQYREHRRLWRGRRRRFIAFFD